MTDDEAISGSVQRFLAGPMERLHRILADSEQDLDERRAELAEMRAALSELSAAGGVPDVSPQDQPVERLPARVAPAVVRYLTEHTRQTLRTCVVSHDAGPGPDDESVRSTQERLARRQFRQRTIYPIEIMDSPDGRERVRSWGAVGEDQRLSLVPPTDFAVFDQDAVVTAATWGEVGSELVLIRHPMLVRAFAELFDRSFARALPVVGALGLPDQEEDLRLLRLLALGLKDESIARYLGCSLRTVRRRVAQVMDRHGVQTRFQLGVAAARHDLVSLRDTQDR